MSNEDLMLVPLEFKVGSQGVDDVCELAGRSQMPNVVLYQPEQENLMVLPRAMLPVGEMC
jgi:hypothetical protein